ncbi:MAG: DUF6528 family protein [Bacteroidales bacterium]|jgi:WD40 repeat protein|nr:DUF6528 family protein [Bacteroidales bacterium]
MLFLHHDRLARYLPAVCVLIIIFSQFPGICKTPPVLHSGSVSCIPSSAVLAVCGDNRIYIVNASKAAESGYETAIMRSWNAAEEAGILGLESTVCDHIDECKPVNGGKDLMVTSSYGWCVLLDICTKKILFHTSLCTGAHSAELLPSGRIAIACSDKGNALQIYDISGPDKIIYSTNFVSAHGLFWNEDTKRLYVAGGQLLNIYELAGWNTSSPSLKLVKSIKTPEGAIHDLTFAGRNKLCISGRCSYLYDMAAEDFEELPLFESSGALKSVNYDMSTGQFWYTDATIPEGNESWSSHTIRYALRMQGGEVYSEFKIPDMDVYKVRVLKW